MEDVTNDMKVADLDNQLDLYRMLLPPNSIPVKYKLRNKDLKREALRYAIQAFCDQGGKV